MEKSMPTSIAVFCAGLSIASMLMTAHLFSLNIEKEKRIELQTIALDSLNYRLLIEQDNFQKNYEILNSKSK